MAPYYIFTTSRKLTDAQVKRINKAIRKIDPSAEFIGPLRIPGNHVTGWIERPNDGTNDHLDVRERNRQMADVALEVIGV